MCFYNKYSQTVRYKDKLAYPNKSSLPYVWLHTFMVVPNLLCWKPACCWLR